MYPVAADTDTGPDGVDPRLGRGHSYLAAESGFAGDGLNLDHAVVDLWHLDLEQAFEHVLVAAGDQNLRALGRASNADQVDLGPLALAVTLRGRLFLDREDGLSAAKIQGDGPAGFGLFYHAGDDVALMLLELLVKEVSLGLTQALQYHLLGGLRGDTAGVVGQRLGGRHLVAQHRTLFDGLGFGYGDLFVSVLDRFNHGFQSKNAHFPGVGIEGDRYILARCRVVFLKS